MIVRTASVEEREALEAIQRRASFALDEYRGVFQAHPDAFGIPLAQFERGDVFVAEVDGRLAGVAALDGGELDGLFVEPDLWRQGIGAALVEAAVHEARRRGLSLVTVVANIGARQFYEKCGFRAEGETETRFGPALRMSR